MITQKLYNQLILGFLIALLFSGCQNPLSNYDQNTNEQNPKSVNGQIIDEDTNTSVLITDFLYKTENGVIAKREKVFESGLRPDSAIILDDNLFYDYNQSVRDGRNLWNRKELKFHATLNRAPKNDSYMVFDHLDLGTLHINQEEAVVLSEANVDFSGLTMYQLDYYKEYFNTLYGKSYKTKAELIYDNTPNNEFYTQYHNNGKIVIKGTESEMIESFSKDIYFPKAPSILEIRNGTVLDIEANIPNISVEEEIVIDFERPIKPNETYIVLSSFTGENSFDPILKNAAFIQPMSESKTIKIGVNTLKEIKAMANTNMFKLSIHSYIEGEDAKFYPLESNGEIFEFPIYTRGSFEMLFQLN